MQIGNVWKTRLILGIAIILINFFVPFGYIQNNECYYLTGGFYELFNCTTLNPYGFLSMFVSPSPIYLIEAYLWLFFTIIIPCILLTITCAGTKRGLQRRGIVPFFSRFAAKLYVVLGFLFVTASIIIEILGTGDIHIPIAAFFQIPIIFYVGLLSFEGSRRAIDFHSSKILVKKADVELTPLVPEKIEKPPVSDVKMKLEKLLRITNQIELDLIARTLGVKDTDLVNMLIELGEKVPVKIEGKIITVENTQTFISLLDEQFRNWKARENVASGKTI